MKNIIKDFNYYFGDYLTALKLDKDALDKCIIPLNKYADSVNIAIRNGATEEHFKNLFRDLLNSTFYSKSKALNTKSYHGQHEADLVLHTGKDESFPVAVIFEFKKPNAQTDMITDGDINRKAFHEAVAYYMQERIKENNNEVKWIIISNALKFYCFDAKDFKRLFYDNPNFNDRFQKWLGGYTDDDRTKEIYSQIKKFISESELEIPCLTFSLIDSDGKANIDDIINIYKFFSPKNLLKEQFISIGNELNKAFYNELLYIMGLEEFTGDGKAKIRRAEGKNRFEGSLIENVIRKLESLGRIKQVNDDGEDEIFNISLELVLTWINRILFLKLLEAQLIEFHNGDADFAFLNKNRIGEFENLETLFFEVLAVKEEDRSEFVNKQFPKLPYLNSALFEPTELETSFLFLSNLKDSLTMPIYSVTALADKKGKSQKTLHYLFDFLNYYNFGVSLEGELLVNTNTIINASVLGLIFEKINGYKDGAVFTPSSITMYIAKESISRALVEKFNKKFNWNLENFEQLRSALEDPKIDRKSAKSVIDSLTVCDPAVGSGHFLVSALNEIIYSKFALGLLLDADCERISRRDYEIKIENDELFILNTDTHEILKYKLGENGKPNSAQRIQKALFEEKRKIIENSLFGVDINPKSVQICRLRLWIELLKNSYYTEESDYKELKTLPNIDINIKEGNSLISRFPMNANLKVALKGISWTFEDYKTAVQEYKDAQTKQARDAHRTLINQIKSNFKIYRLESDPRRKKLEKLSDEFAKLFGEKLFETELSKNAQEAETKRKEQLQKEIKKIEEELKDEEGGALYKNAFEWRFEFPEVLDDDTNFIGFDIVMGNPPYGVNLLINAKEYFRTQYEVAHSVKGVQKGSVDTFALFIELGLNLLNKHSPLGFIVPLAITSSDSMTALHNKLFTECESIYISNYSNRPLKIFDNADQRVSVINCFKNNKPIKYLYTTKVNKRYEGTSVEELIENLSFVNSVEFIKYGRLPKVGSQIELSILKKLFASKQTLKDLITEKGEPIYYRTSGGRYYNIITNFSTQSTKESSILVDNEYRNLIAAILSSNFYYWFYHIFSNNLDLKKYELEIFPIPIEKFSTNKIQEIGIIYSEYLTDLKKHSRIKKVNYAHVSEYREYYARHSKQIIDRIDLAIKDAYSLSDDEVNFLINYDLKFRTDDEE